jgi:hypothetical protein
MARTNNPLLQQQKGTIGKQIVFKQYGDKMVVSNN